MHSFIYLQKQLFDDSKDKIFGAGESIRGAGRRIRQVLSPKSSPTYEAPDDLYDSPSTSPRPPKYARISLDPEMSSDDEY